MGCSAMEIIFIRRFEEADATLPVEEVEPSELL